MRLKTSCKKIVLSSNGFILELSNGVHLFKIGELNNQLNEIRLKFTAMYSHSQLEVSLLHF